MVESPKEFRDNLPIMNDRLLEDLETQRRECSVMSREIQDLQEKLAESTGTLEERLWLASDTLAEEKERYLALVGRLEIVQRDHFNSLAPVEN